MRIDRVKYGYTFNHPNYRSERIDLEAQLEPGEDYTEQFYRLKGQVQALGGDDRAAISAIDLADRIAADRRGREG